MSVLHKPELPFPIVFQRPVRLRSTWRYWLLQLLGKPIRYR